MKILCQERYEKAVAYAKEIKNDTLCRPLDEHQSEQLARMIIASTKREVRYGVTRVERVTAPTGAVILF